MGIRIRWFTMILLADAEQQEFAVERLVLSGRQSSLLP